MGGNLGTWKALYGDFMSMDDDQWEAVDARLAQSFSPEKCGEIEGDFIAFTRFVWGAVIEHKLHINDEVIEQIAEVRGAESLDKLGVREENLQALRPQR